MEEYLWQRKILFKDYSEPVKQVSERLKRDALRPFQLRGRKPVFLQSPAADKDRIARQIAANQNIASGPVCALRCLEPSPTFEHRGTRIIRRIRPCHVLYCYQIHPELGWMRRRACRVRARSNPVSF